MVSRRDSDPFLPAHSDGLGRYFGASFGTIAVTLPGETPAGAEDYATFMNERPLMRCLALNLVVAMATIVLLVAGTQRVQAQQLQAQALGPGVGIRNDLKVPVIVQGVSIVNNMQRRGQPFVIQPGKSVWDNNLPLGLRFYTVYEATSQRILLKDQKVAIQMRADQVFAIKLAVGSVKMEQEPVPMKETPKDKK